MDIHSLLAVLVAAFSVFSSVTIYILMKRGLTYTSMAFANASFVCMATAMVIHAYGEVAGWGSMGSDIVPYAFVFLAFLPYPFLLFKALCLKKN